MGEWLVIPHSLNAGYFGMWETSYKDRFDQISAGLASQAKETQGSGEVGKYFRIIILVTVTTGTERN